MKDNLRSLQNKDHKDLFLFIIAKNQNLPRKSSISWISKSLGWGGRWGKGYNVKWKVLVCYQESFYVKVKSDVNKN